LPGDIVIGTPTGVSFIPAHLAAEVAAVSEDVQIRDEFGKQRLAEGVYTPAEIDVPTWAEHIEADFQQWREQHAG
jgi:regulator of RNase E activity RraA